MCCFKITASLQLFCHTKLISGKAYWATTLVEKKAKTESRIVSVKQHWSLIVSYDWSAFVENFRKNSKKLISVELML